MDILHISQDGVRKNDSMALVYGVGGGGYAVALRPCIAIPFPAQMPSAYAPLLSCPSCPALSAISLSAVRCSPSSSCSPCRLCQLCACAARGEAGRAHRRARRPAPRRCGGAHRTRGGLGGRGGQRGGAAARAKVTRTLSWNAVAKQATGRGVMGVGGVVGWVGVGRDRCRGTGRRRRSGSH